MIMSACRLGPALVITGLIAAFWGAVAAAQSVAIQPRFQNVGHFHERLAPAQEDDLWGFIDRSGNWVIRPRYDGVLRGGDGRFGIKEGDRWGFINTVGETIVPPTYDEARPFSGGTAAVKRQGRWGFINTFGAIETPLAYLEVARREGNLFPAYDAIGSDEPNWFVMRTQPGVGAQSVGSVQIWLGQNRGSASPERVYGFSEGASVAKFEFGEMLIGPDGEPITQGNLNEQIFTSIRRRSEGWAAARRGTQWGYIDEEGKFLSWRELEGAREFSMGVAPIKAGGKWGYMTKDARFVLKPRYDRAYSFHEGFATMRVGQKRGFLKMEGGRVSVFVEPSYEDVFRFQEGLAPIKEGGLWGFLSNGQGGSGSGERGIVDLIPE